MCVGQHPTLHENLLLRHRALPAIPSKATAVPASPSILQSGARRCRNVGFCSQHSTRGWLGAAPRVRGRRRLRVAGGRRASDINRGPPLNDTTQSNKREPTQARSVALTISCCLRLAATRCACTCSCAFLSSSSRRLILSCFMTSFRRFGSSLMPLMI